jgi:hypothetical protein
VISEIPERSVKGWRNVIDAFILEFNFEWAKGLKKVPQGKDWELMGNQLKDVFLDYFDGGDDAKYR